MKKYLKAALLLFLLFVTTACGSEAETTNGYFYEEVKNHQTATPAPEQIPPIPILPSPAVNPPVLSSITVRPPLWDIFPESDLTISFTHVFDFINGADACNQSSRWYYLTPEGSVRFNRDVELSFFDIDCVKTHTFMLPARETLYVRDFTRFNMYYGTAVFDEMPYFQRLDISFIVTHDESQWPLVVDMSQYGINSEMFKVSFWRVDNE